jgi:LSD1 subclass zinc finger protein
MPAAQTARLVDRSSTEDRLLGVRCSGRKRDNSPCNKLLAEMDLKPGSYVRVKCGHCNTFNVFTGRTAA